MGMTLGKPKVNVQRRSCVMRLLLSLIVLQQCSYSSDSNVGYVPHNPHEIW